ncbi:membrane-bound dehydrogenase [Planomonospora sphaerica]|uniref:Membrane-bound dehydrogenase n=1 Tax=Planomonospora sphaerica TaxID=161355 RepID=A0A161LUR3_9ACTN|nr:CehA/McbA family metallohydrolase [Planomonospora sphaerica]GAT65391.1 membrane-bound dehydrogenase [Planomonospora sphaerica]
MLNDPLLPEAVARALGHYRALRDRHGVCWGEELIPYVGEVRTSEYLMGGHDYWSACSAQLGGAARRDLDARMGELDLDRLVRDALAGDVPDNLAVLRLTPDGAVLRAVTAVVLDDAPLETTLLLDSGRAEPVTVVIDETPYEVAPYGARLVGIDAAARVTVEGERVDLGVLSRRADRARIRLRAGFPCRWSVTGANGQGWYPPGAPRALDHHRRPYFHGDDLLLDVPAEQITVAVTRGMEYTTAELALRPAPGEERLVELRPERLYDAAARGWYGGDLHVHLNWMGDEPAAPARAAAAQHGEDLHVLNLVAGNVAGERVYDREALAHWAGEDLPWSDERHLARFGVEYRNDLLGHVTAFGLSAPPGRFHSGFAGGPDAEPNSAALEELRRLGALTGYGHPFHADLSEDDPPERGVAAGRNCSAREVVADAALGLVDALDVLNHSSILATAVVYRHLVGAGCRLAVTAGSDSVLSISRRGTASSPPGWQRVYARVEGPLTAESFAEAVRRGRTFATTGPWLWLSVDGHGPGDTLELAAGDRVRIRAGAIGPEAERLEIRTGDGVLACGPPDGLTAELVVREPTYVVAVATGGPHPRSCHPSGAYAHTSPVYLDVAGAHVARRADLEWCLGWLDRLGTLLREDGRFASDEQYRAHLDLYRRAGEVYRSRLGRR